MYRPTSIEQFAREQVPDQWIKNRVSEDRLPLAISGDLVVVGGITAKGDSLGDPGGW